jgi:hypothetical protein
MAPSAMGPVSLGREVSPDGEIGLSVNRGWVWQIRY